MTQSTDDLAAQMVREMQTYPQWPGSMLSIARRYMEKAVELDRANEAERLPAAIQNRKFSAERAGKDGRMTLVGKFLETYAGREIYYRMGWFEVYGGIGDARRMLHSARSRASARDWIDDQRRARQ